MNFDADEDLDNVESAGLKSKLRELQKTCAALQKQAVKLKMAKAPLEARMRQNDDNWRKEKVRRERAATPFAPPSHNFKY